MIFISGSRVVFENIDGVIFVWVNDVRIGGFPSEELAMHTVAYRLAQRRVA
jgi:hypothetical protein